jgi:hypothetical protein
LAASQRQCTQHIIEQLAGWPDKWLTLQIFLTTGAFAHKQPTRCTITDTGYGVFSALA